MARSACQLLGVALAAMVCMSATASLLERFDEGWEGRWIHSSSAKYDGKFKAVQPKEWSDDGIQMVEKSKHYGLTHMLSEPMDPSQGLVLQYEVRFTNGISCGGAYIKLLSDTADLSAEGLSDASPYSIMFGPDKCGQPMGKLHLIFRHSSPLDGNVEEKHVQAGADPSVDTYTHVYTLVIQPDSSYKVLVDGEVKDSGSLLDEAKFTPPFNPPEMIPDPEDKKPEDWVDQAKIPDPEAVKPEDWEDEPMVDDMQAVKPKGWQDDEPAFVNDPKAAKPSDWDDEEDGDWEPSQIPNPKCKVGCGEWKRPKMRNAKYTGPWSASLIDNPEYKGKWVQKQIPNPSYYRDEAPLNNVAPIKALAFELWTIDSGYTFDNVLLSTNEAEAEQAREELWKPRNDAEKEAHSKALKAAEKAASKSLADVIIAAFDQPPLAAAKPYVQPLLDALKAQPYMAYAIFAVPLVAMLLCLCFPSSSSKKRAAAARAKKDDSYQPDEEEEEEEQPAASPGRTRSAAAAATPARSGSPRKARANHPSPKGDDPGPVSHEISHQEVGTEGASEGSEGEEEPADTAEQPRRRSSRLRQA